ncbi:MAG: hypothetical protein VXZ29_03780 [Pseudomonadota bacterium]|nr:hypothetical protein [Pseudomonadota bacterium]
MMIANTRHHSLTALGLMVMFALVLFAFKEDKEHLSLEGLTMGTSYKIQLLEIPGEKSSATNLQLRVSQVLSQASLTWEPSAKSSHEVFLG